MSTIYNALFQELEPNRYTAAGPPNACRIEAGFVLEAAVEDGLKRRLTVQAERPGEFVTDEGIIYSPDLLIFNGSTKVGEIKLTWMSSREVPRTAGKGVFPKKFEKYFVQMKAYCHCLHVDEARLYTFFINGDYRRMTPEFLAWDLQFTQQELRDNWTMLINYARHKGFL